MHPNLLMSVESCYRWFMSLLLCPMLFVWHLLDADQIQHIYWDVNVRVQIKLWPDFNICWLKIKLRFLREEIKIVTSVGRILNHASIDRNFNTYWDKFIFSYTNFSQSDFKFYPFHWWYRSTFLQVEIKTAICSGMI